jgi:pimeloyl-ACP methyl ester carboxylesterase
MAAALWAEEAPSRPLTAQQDHQLMMEALKIDSLRPGANGMDANAPNAANYDESKANPYPTLPDPLALKNGEAVVTAEAWWKQRRPEIVEDFDREVYGRVPENAPAVRWEVVETVNEKVGDYQAKTKKLVGHVDNSSYPQITVDIQLTLSTPANARGPVPVMLEFGFAGFGGPRRGRAGGPPREPGWQQQALEKGWGYAVLVPTSIQADNGAGLTQGIIGLCNKGESRKPEDWGALRAWAWGASRAVDYFETDGDVDARQVGIEGLSRYGKAALVTMAYDPRFAIGFIGSSGEGGAKLHRRNFGELVENLTGSGEYHWMGGNFLKYGGPLTPGDLPVDSHELIAMCAPRPVFISYGASSGPGAEGQWVDQRGSFMATVAAGPVYRLLGKKDLGTDQFPEVETPIVDGELAFRQHKGGHTTGPNWPTFLAFADRYVQLAEASAPPPESKEFTGEHTSWHGFDRYDFLMDESTLEIKPIVAKSEEGNSSGAPVAGQLRCVVVVPKEAAEGKPWSWRGYYFDHEPQTEVELLKRGYHIGYCQHDAGEPWDAWYEFLTKKHGLAAKPAFIGMSRGGRNAFTWATNHPDKVSAIYVDNPAVTHESLMKLDGLAKNDVPLLHVCGSLDPLLGGHTLAVESIYTALGGRISVMIKDGAGHHPHSLRDPKPLADFIESGFKPREITPPAYVTKGATKTSLYPSRSSYRMIESEPTPVSCRGPAFGPCYDRYQFQLEGVQGNVTVIVPEKPAAGAPWIYRADLVTRESQVDLALLEQGFHIVTGPVPYNADGLLLADWNKVYQHLVDHGFSMKPVLEGTGGAAGEAFGWAMENPERISGIYAENAFLRSTMIQRPVDDPAPLASAGIPVLAIYGEENLPASQQVILLREKSLASGRGLLTRGLKGQEIDLRLGPDDLKAAVQFIQDCADRNGQ